MDGRYILIQGGKFRIGYTDSHPLHHFDTLSNVIDLLSDFGQIYNEYIFQNISPSFFSDRDIDIIDVKLKKLEAFEDRS